MSIQVAIDGPAGAGKSTVARQVAARLNVPYIDTGAMYRGVTLMAMKRGVLISDEEGLAAIAASVRLRFAWGEAGQRVYMDEMDVTDEIRSPEVGSRVSTVAKYGQVRRQLVDLQKKIAKDSGSVVMDGRDIGTHVLPEADVKIFLTASIEARAKRRHAELLTQGFAGSLLDVLQVLQERDAMDSAREVSPLRPASDAVILDSTSLSIAEVVDAIIDLCGGRCAQGS